MKILIAVTTCHAFQDRAAACRETWVKLLPEGADLRFFYGRQLFGEKRGPAADEIFLDVDDGYRSLVSKVQAIRRWAIDHGYDFTWKLDDDAYVRLERLLAIDVSGHDYIGRVRGPSGNYPAPYCSGFCYGLSRRAMEKLATIADMGEDIYEDRWTGNKLLELGVRPYHVEGFIVQWSKHNYLNGRESPHVNNDVVVSCEYNRVMMKQIHQDFDRSVQREMKRLVPVSGESLSRVCVMIKTFLRDGPLLATLAGLDNNFSDVKVVVVDDGYESRDKVRKYAELRRNGDAAIWLPFDSGFGAKANAAVKACDREYVLIGSDDFDFNDRRVRPGVVIMQRILDADPEVGVVSGRVNACQYEAIFDEQDGMITEKPGHYATRYVGAQRYKLCDLTVNYSLVRRTVLDQVKWDEDVKIGGGEHGAFFLDVKRAGWKVAVVETANIYEYKPNFEGQHKNYRELRARAKQDGRPCLKRRGINKWVCQDGTEEIC